MSHINVRSAKKPEKARSSQSLSYIWPTVALILVVLVFTLAELGEANTQSQEDNAAHWSEIYNNGFETSTLGVEAEGLFILDGDFRVSEIQGNHVLRLPGKPTGEFGILFGPRRSENSMVGVRTYSESAGRRMPTFGVGLSGRSGIRLLVKPAARKIQILSGRRILAQASYRWSSGVWISISLKVVRRSESAWEVSGKAWETNNSEIRETAVLAMITEKPTVGRASLWGIPNSGKPILFDDLLIYSINPVVRF